jgi:chemotaxis response regulator CheB
MEEYSPSAGERLQRKGEASPSGIANLIVIGASAGGHKALIEILQNVSANMPAAIVILLHLPLESASTLKDVLGRFSRLPIISVKDREPPQQGFIFIPPPGIVGHFQWRDDHSRGRHSAKAREHNQSTLHIGLPEL